MLDTFFCAAESRAHGETLYGTVAQIRSWLLLEYPNAWRPHAIEDSRILSPPVKQYLGTQFNRSLLIRQQPFRTGLLRCFRISEDRIRRSTLDSYQELLQPQPEEAVSGPLYAVCTHGKHDKCCAKFGLPVFCEFRDRVGERAWQCSHVGGDRFAANVVVFPHGLFYGHVDPSEVPDLIRHAEAGEVWLPRYRGRASFSRAAQIAEYFVRSETGRLAVDEFEVAGVRRDGPLTQVSFHARSDASLHFVEFARKPEVLRQLLTCGSTELCDVPQYELVRYRLAGDSRSR